MEGLKDFKSMLSARIESEPIYSRTKSSFNLETKMLAVKSTHTQLLLFSKNLKTKATK